MSTHIGGTVTKLSLVLLMGCSSEKPQFQKAREPAADAGTLDSGSGRSDAATLPTQVAPDAAEPQTPCNTSAIYCSMRYDELCQAATRDSAANTAVSWRNPSQARAILTQLQQSIRVLMLEVKDYQGVVSVCRSDCTTGNTPLGGVLETVKDFLTSNPSEVVTLLIDTGLSAATIQAEFVKAGLDSMAWPQPDAAAWPTLKTMIDSGERLVVFANTPDRDAAWLLPRQNHIWETGSHWVSVSEMNCAPAIGDASRPLYLVHQNLVSLGDAGQSGQPNSALASQANDWQTATARLQACGAQWKRVPNFLAVDFFDEGDPLGATQVLNGVRAAP